MVSPEKDVCGKCGPARIAGGQSAADSGVHCPNCETPVPLVALPASSGELSGGEMYNIVSDLMIGVNVRWRDNLAQAAAIGVCIVLGVLIGALAVQEHAAGAVVGGFIGLLVGFFGSGVFLMVYRFVQHLLGHHR